MIYKPGERIYKYELEKCIGGGAFGEVWLANDISLQSTCALKILPQNNTSIDDRLLEAQIGNRLRHANVVNIKYADVIKDGRDENIVAIAMPFYTKGNILRQLNSDNFLDFKHTIKCLTDILKGLEYLHENGYYHCDIKPSNILVGDRGEYILSDYGITCYSPEHAAVQPRNFYLPHISPETLLTGMYDARTDIYQLGLTAFRLVNGISEIENDFQNTNKNFRTEVISGNLVNDSRYCPYVPRKIRRIINKAIAVEPEERYQSALEMRRALEQLHLSGNCTTDDNGRVIIINNGYTYRYETVTKSAKISDFNVYKKSLKTSKETRAVKYTKRNVKNKDINKEILNLATALL